MKSVDISIKRRKETRLSGKKIQKVSEKYFIDTSSSLCKHTDMPAPSPFRRPKIDDVVRLAGVSRSSVFRFLNGQRLKPAIHEAVELALRRSGYLPSTEAAPIASEILISAPSAIGAFRGYADQVEGIMARAAELGIGVQLSLRGLEE